MSDYKMAVFEFAKSASDEEFTKVITRFEQMQRSMSEFLETVSILNPYLTVPIEKTEAAVEGLCEICANPCAQQKPETVDCRNFSEYKAAECSRCVYWDYDTCKHVDSCIDGKLFEAVGAEPISV